MRGRQERSRLPNASRSLVSAVLLLAAVFGLLEAGSGLVDVLGGPGVEVGGGCPRTCFAPP